MELYFWPVTTTTTPSKRKCVPPQHTQKPLISVFCLLIIAASAAFFSFNRSMKRENAKWNTLMDTRGARRLIFSKWRYLSQNEQQKPPTKSSRIQEEMLCLCYLKKLSGMFKKKPYLFCCLFMLITRAKKLLSANNSLLCLLHYSFLLYMCVCLFWDLHFKLNAKHEMRARERKIRHWLEQCDREQNRCAAAVSRASICICYKLTYQILGRTYKKEIK